MDGEAKTAEQLRETILKRRFSRLYVWNIPDVDFAVGPHDSSPFARFEERRRSLLEQARQSLTQFSDEQLLLLSNITPTLDENLKTWLRDFRDRSDKLFSDEPPWHAGGFGHPDHRADFEYWARMSSFTVPEIVCLSLGVEPDSFPPDEIVRLKKSARAQLSDVLQFLVRREEQVRRQFHQYSVFPSEFLEWVSRISLDVHPEFIRLLTLYHSRSQSLEKGTTTGAVARSSPDRREIDSVAMVLTAMAIDAYGYDPAAKRSPIPKEISDIAWGLGLSTTDDTVRKYLKLGATFLPEGWKPE